jgi:carboxyl-terminal processing protease
MYLNPITVLKHSLKFSYLSLICALNACGGSAGDEASPSSPTANSSLSSSANKDMCANPRTGLDPFNNNRPYPDKAGSLQNEKDWLRAWIDETYLWYSEVPKNLNPSHYATAIDYFNALKTPALTASGKEKDHYHFTESTAESQKQSQSGVVLGYGMEISYVSTQPPRKFIVAFVEPNSPAENAGIRRGMEIESIDGYALINSNNTDALNSGLFPTTENQAHSFGFKDSNGNKFNKTLLSADIQKKPVQNVKSFSTPTGKVGYLTFNSHNAIAEKQLIDAVDQLKSEGVTDLILDLRYNGGGAIYIADELSYMIAGPVQTQGKTFYKKINNDKAPFNPNNIWPFYQTSLFSNALLPTLNLKQVTILAGSGTCSASEAIINGLRGIDVKVNLIGGQTCGKPYGFIPQDNCGTTYYAVQFKGENNKGFGDFPDGFSPTCPVEEDFSAALGDKNERLISAALNYRATGQCPANGQGQAVRTSKLLRPAIQEIMTLERPQR